MSEHKCNCDKEVKCPNCKCTVVIKQDSKRENQSESKKMNLND